MEENLPPFEMFERFVAEYSDEHLEPKIKTLRTEARQLKKTQELWEAEVTARLDTLRREQEAATASLHREHQVAIDSLTSQLAQLKVELNSVRRYTATALVKEALGAAMRTLPPDSGAMVVRKYEAITTELDYSNDPIEVAARFLRFCVTEAQRCGIPVVSPGLRKPV